MRTRSENIMGARAGGGWISWAGALVLAILPLTPSTAGQLIPVPRVVIYPGDPIIDKALDDRELDLGTGSAETIFMRRSQLIGKVARRTLLPGLAIPLGAVKSPDLVRAGKSVTLVFTSGLLVIMGQGLAMQSGGSGDLIAVQNQESGTIVRGVVSPEGVVRVGD